MGEWGYIPLISLMLRFRAFLIVSTFVFLLEQSPARAAFHAWRKIREKDAQRDRAKSQSEKQRKQQEENRTDRFRLSREFGCFPTISPNFPTCVRILSRKRRGPNSMGKKLGNAAASRILFI